MRALKVDSVVPLERSARLLGRKITLAWQKSVEGILEAGTLLIQAKAELVHGDFERMVAQSCPFGIRTAQMLMRISSHPILSNTQNSAYLPSAWNTLAELAKFEPQELSHAIGNHWVKPDMPRKDVPELHRRVRVALGTVRRSPTRREPNVVQMVVDRKTDRWVNLAELAAEGNTSHQIAEKVGVKRQAVVNAAKRRGVVLQADLVVGRTRLLDPNRILKVFVETLESLAPSCEMIDPSKVDPDVLSECIIILDKAMKALGKLRNRLVKWQLREAS